jgi:hypothetical protein
MTTPNAEAHINRFVLPILAVAGIFGFLLVTSAAPQGYPPQYPQKAAPKVGAWWYTGTTPPPLLDGHPDMTGVWYGGTSADLSKDAIKGQEMILTPYGAERYKTVDHSKDPNTACLPPGPARMIMMLHPTMLVQRPAGYVGDEHSDRFHLTEKFRLADRNTLELIVTYDDQVFFQKPFTTRRADNASGRRPDSFTLLSGE